MVLMTVGEDKRKVCQAVAVTKSYQTVSSPARPPARPPAHPSQAEPSSHAVGPNHLETTLRAPSWLRRSTRGEATLRPTAGHPSREASRNPSREPSWEASREASRRSSHTRPVGADDLWWAAEAAEGPRARGERHAGPGRSGQVRREYGEDLARAAAVGALGGCEGGCGEECDEGELHVGCVCVCVVGLSCCCF